MPYKRILTIQDISCLGQCSLTVALPIISAAKQECVVIPTVVLSTHTAIEGFTYHDLSDQMPKINNHFINNNYDFDIIYTGYLGNKKQIDYSINFVNSVLKKDGIFVVDPAMADFGKLYTNFDMDFVKEMKRLCLKADIIIPNITEACLLTDSEYKEEYDEEYIMNLFKKLNHKCVILTGVSYRKGYTGIASYNNGSYNYYEHLKVDKTYHGTGDIYASSFVGALANDFDIYEASKIAADFVLEAIKQTDLDPNKNYGVKFEPALEKYILMLKRGII